MIKHRDRKNYTMGVRIDLKTLEALEAVALREHRTISDLVRLWIIDRLAKEAKPKKASNQ